MGVKTMAKKITSTAFRVRCNDANTEIRSLDVKLDEPNASRGRVNEKSVMESFNAFAEVAQVLRKAYAIAGITAEGDCVEIHTGQCTTIKINCEEIIVIEDDE
jgi:hypothetical protein